jgi:hypothetical protein
MGLAATMTNGAPPSSRMDAGAGSTLGARTAPGLGVELVTGVALRHASATTGASINESRPARANVQRDEVTESLQ